MFVKLQEKFLLFSIGQRAKKQTCPRTVIVCQIIEVKGSDSGREAEGVVCLISGKLTCVCHMRPVVTLTSSDPVQLRFLEP